MEAQKPETVYDNIVAHIKKQGGEPSGWYTGIASDWEDRLFNQHNVPRKDYWRIAKQCYTSDEARKVERALLNYGCDGGPSGGDETTVYVYAYLKGSMTQP
jgi:hypothetical protein